MDETPGPPSQFDPASTPTVNSCEVLIGALQVRREELQRKLVETVESLLIMGIIEGARNPDELAEGEPSYDITSSLISMPDAVREISIQLGEVEALLEAAQLLWGNGQSCEN